MFVFDQVRAFLIWVRWDSKMGRVGPPGGFLLPGSRLNGTEGDVGNAYPPFDPAGACANPFGAAYGCWGSRTVGNHYDSPTPRVLRDPRRYLLEPVVLPDSGNQLGDDLPRPQTEIKAVLARILAVDPPEYLALLLRASLLGRPVRLREQKWVAAPAAPFAFVSHL